MSSIEKNIILYFPFDEGNGSKTAFDYSTNRADGVVKNAEFTAGKIGNAIKFEGDGTVEVPKEVMSEGVMNSEWSILAWIDSTGIEAGSPKMAIWNIAMSGVNNFVENRITLQPGTWSHLAITKRGNTYNFYLNTILVDTIVRAGHVTGMSLSQDYFGSDYGKGCVDDLKIFNIALSAEDLVNQMANVKTLEYSIDGVNLKEYGVFVSDSKGLTDRPKMKKPYLESWADYHGSMVDLNHKFLEDRVITLNCFIKSDNGKGEFVSAVNKFLQIFDEHGTHRLMVDIHPTKPLVYEVYLEDSVEFAKTWNDGLMVGTFTLKLREPSPVKRVLKYMKVDNNTPDVSITIETNKSVDVHWGDGSSVFDVSGKQTLTHKYKDTGDYYIIVSGCIDEIIKFETNAIIVWQKI